MTAVSNAWHRPADIEGSTFHRGLAAFNRARLAPSCGSPTWRDGLRIETTWRLREESFIARELAAVAPMARTAPADPDGFVRWFEDLKTTGPGQGDPLFPWLAEEAPRDALVWFLTQEIAGEAGFDDLVALTQVKLPTTAKLELARNYWDEMGQGHASGMHGPMLDRLAQELSISAEEAEVVWEAVALGNAMTAFACNRRYTFHSVGALGAIELTAPGRATLVNAGLKRVGVGGAARRYFALHATLDVKHSTAWNREVLRSLVAEDPRRAHAMAAGALVRLEAGRRCFERYRRELGLDSASDRASGEFAR